MGVEHVYTIRNGEHEGGLVWVSEVKKVVEGRLRVRSTAGTRLT